MAAGPDDRRATQGQSRAEASCQGGARRSSGRTQTMQRTREAPAALPIGRDGLAIEVRGLVMRYGDREVLHGIDLVVTSWIYFGKPADIAVRIQPI